MLVETILPIDYYTNMIGALVDQKVLDILIKNRIPDLWTHFSNIMYEPSMSTTQWFLCIFSYNFNFEVIERIWDLFFLKG